MSRKMLRSCHNTGEEQTHSASLDVVLDCQRIHCSPSANSSAKPSFVCSVTQRSVPGGDHRAAGDGGSPRSAFGSNLGPQSTPLVQIRPQPWLKLQVDCFPRLKCLSSTNVWEIRDPRLSTTHSGLSSFTLLSHRLYKRHKENLSLGVVGVMAPVNLSTQAGGY